MEKIKNTFKKLITPFIDENGIEMSFHEYIDNGFKAEFNKDGKNLTNVTFSGGEALLDRGEDQINKMIAYYVSATINSCKGN